MHKKRSNKGPKRETLLRKSRGRGAIYRRVRGIITGVMIVSTAHILLAQFIYTPKLYLLTEDRDKLQLKYAILEQRVAIAQSSVDDMWRRDNELYRTLFGTDSIHIENIYNPYPDSRYDFLLDDDYGALSKSVWLKMDDLAKGLYRNSLSFDEISLLSSDKDKLSSAIPAIWPIDRTKLRGSIGAFGNRLHPIYKKYIMHKGVDLNCLKGDPIYATADGVVEKTERGLYRKGYGQMILLNHNYGYKTRYAHMSRMLVQKGDSVKRGDIIGEAGSTGGSTGVHLHYEVIRNGAVVNPINYFDRHMTNEEYANITNRLIDANYEIIE